MLTPFLGAYNKKTGGTVHTSGLERVAVDGSTVAHNDTSLTAGDLLPHDAHDVMLFLPAVGVSNEGGASTSAADAPAQPSAAAPSSSDAAADASSPVDRVCNAPHEFAELELPLAEVGQAAVRKAYRRVSLSVHPDKVSHPRAAEAFRRAFDAMKLLMDRTRMAHRLREIHSGESGGEGEGGRSQLPAETRWWDAASVTQMEQAFRNLEEFLEAQGAFGDDAVDDYLWVGGAEAERLRRSDLAYFDARDTPDFGVSHVRYCHPKRRP